MLIFRLAILSVLLAQSTVHSQRDYVAQCDFEAGLCTFQPSSTGGLNWMSQCSPNEPAANIGLNSAYHGGCYVIAEGTGEDHGGEAILSSPVLWYKGDICVEFAYFINGSFSGSLAVYIETMENGKAAEILTVREDQTAVWQYIQKQVYIESPCSKISMVASSEQSGQSKIALDDINISLGSCPSVVKRCPDGFVRCDSGGCIPRQWMCDGQPDCCDGFDEMNCDLFSCTFERDTCGMVRPSDGWVLNVGPTLSYHTGPTEAISGKQYIYFETSRRMRGDRASLQSPPLNHTGAVCVSFFYHMYGTTMGELHVALGNTTLRVISGNQENKWWYLEMEANIPSHNMSIGLLGIRGNGFQSDMAVDNITIQAGRCASPVCSASEFRCGSGECTAISNLCDHKTDCNDGSDQYTCHARPFTTDSPTTIETATKSSTIYFPTSNTEDDSPSTTVFPSATTQVSACRDEQYQCSNGRCIPGSFKCDGDLDCTGGEDEHNCISACRDDQYQCSNGRCIPGSFKCDGDLDCTGACTSMQWRCDNGICTSARHFCNNVAECLDGSDELHCNGTCLSGQFNCDETRCIDQSLVCDGKDNCIDRQDETNCTHHNCSGRFESLCGSGECISVSDWCNGVVDCGDGSDEEMGCFNYCPGGRPKCMVRGRPTCLSDYYICDGHPHCDDGVDETDCSCRDDQYQCSNGRCISGHWKCDGDLDCTGGDDEHNCTCTSMQWRCDNGICTSARHFCNNVAECLDGSDELHCNGTCLSGQFNCDETRCIDQNLVCNGKDNCIDRQDETNCTIRTCSWRYESLCGNGECISMSDWCNGVVDCGDGSDEEIGCFNHCPTGRPKCMLHGRPTCLSDYYICDGQPHCDDGLDETDCRGRCPSVCNNDTCLRRSKWCDGQLDCPEGEDELPGCEKICNDHDVLCGDICLDSMYVCNGRVDCVDWSDESNCSCDHGFRCSNGLCQSNVSRCDGRDDCGDQSDEQDCPCDDGHTCGDGHCISAQYACDQIYDCDDRSDEHFCYEPGNYCHSHEFACSNDACIAMDWVCDGYGDCPDEEDESNCANCSTSQFPCANNRQCVPEDNRCNGIHECKDGSDERKCIDTIDGGDANETSILTAMHNGSMHLISATNWTDGDSDLVCSELGHGGAERTEFPKPAPESPEDRACLVKSTDAALSIPLLKELQPGPCVDGVVAVACRNNTCGKPSRSIMGDRQPTIVNGQEAEWPWMVSLERSWAGHSCGGTIINSQYVITAAHCVTYWYMPDVYLLKMSSKDRNYPTQIRKIDKITIHPSYQHLDNDIALLKLAQPITMDENTQPLCLPTSSDYNPMHSVVCKTSGWGRIRPNGPVPFVLRDAKIPVLEDDVCYNASSFDSAKMICTGNDPFQTGACNGDSGGPYFCKDEFDTWTLAGVVSWGSNFCNNHTVFTRVSTYLDWIHSVIDEDHGFRSVGDWAEPTTPWYRGGGSRTTPWWTPTPWSRGGGSRTTPWWNPSPWHRGGGSRTTPWWNPSPRYRGRGSRTTPPANPTPWYRGGGSRTTPPANPTPWYRGGG